MAAPSASDRVIVVTGGDPVERAALVGIPDDAIVIAADSGVGHAQALGLRIHLAVGDFDSVDPAALRAAEAAGARIERHPAAKDATDLELALDAALALGPAAIRVLGGHGGRLDHLLANVLLLASPRYEHVDVSARMGTAHVTVIRREAALTGEPDGLVTLLAAHGPALGVTTEGLRYPLTDEDLHPGSTRGVSNVLLGTHAQVRLAAGVLLAVQPDRSPSAHQPRTT